MSEILRTRPNASHMTAAPIRNQVLLKVLLGNIQDAADAIARCTADRDQRSVFAFPALRDELLEALSLICGSLRALSFHDASALCEVDRAAWDSLEAELQSVIPSRAWRDCIWEAATVLVPHTRAAVSLYLRRQTGGTVPVSLTLG